jgi:hypothetical protein
MMSEELPSDEKMWQGIDPKLRADWAVLGAAYDNKVLAAVEMMDEYKDRASANTLSIARDGLRAYILNTYDSVPADRIDDVLMAAKSIIKEEKVANGEA